MDLGIIYESSMNGSCVGAFVWCGCVAISVYVCVVCVRVYVLCRKCPKPRTFAGVCVCAGVRVLWVGVRVCVCVCSDLHPTKAQLCRRGVRRVPWKPVV